MDATVFLLVVITAFFDNLPTRNLRTDTWTSFKQSDKLLAMKPVDPAHQVIIEQWPDHPNQEQLVNRETNCAVAIAGLATAINAISESA